MGMSYIIAKKKTTPKLKNKTPKKTKLVKLVPYNV